MIKGTQVIYLRRETNRSKDFSMVFVVEGI